MIYLYIVLSVLLCVLSCVLSFVLSFVFCFVLSCVCIYLFCLFVFYCLLLFIVVILKKKIQKAAELMDSKNYKGVRLKAVPIYAGLPAEKQMKVFAPTNSKIRKVVIATNIAETSVTIDGVVYVIDCGFVKIKTYSGKTGIEALVVVPVSQASANQRAGRAGRNRPGKCYRLFPESSWPKLPLQTPPEIQRSNLSSIVLQLKGLGNHHHTNSHTIIILSLISSPFILLLTIIFPSPLN